MDRLKLWEIFSYNKETGELIRKYKSIADRPCGTKNIVSKHMSVSFDGKQEYVHRIIYMMHFGYIPPKYDIDHINGDPTDNRLENLRAVPHAINRRNSKKSSNNTTGVTGVYYQHGKYVAKIKVDYKSKHLGSFKTIEEAARARRVAEQEYNFHTNHGA